MCRDWNHEPRIDLNTLHIYRLLTMVTLWIMVRFNYTCVQLFYWICTYCYTHLGRFKPSTRHCAVQLTHQPIRIDQKMVMASWDTAICELMIYLRLRWESSSTIPTIPIKILTFGVNKPQISNIVNSLLMLDSHSLPLSPPSCHFWWLHI